MKFQKDDVVEWCGLRGVVVEAIEEDGDGALLKYRKSELTSTI